MLRYIKWELSMEQLLLVPDVSAIVNISALAVILIFAIVGAVVGFAKTFFKTFGTILALFFAVILCSSVSRFLESQFGFVSYISEKISGLVGNFFGEDVMNGTVLEATKKGLTEKGLSIWLVNIILGFQSDVPLDVSIKDVLCPTFAFYISMVVSGLILFIIFKIIFFLIGELISKLHVIKVVGALDRFLGLLLGLLRAVVFIQIALLIVNILPFGFTKTLYEYMNQSFIITAISKINLFGLILNSINFDNVMEFVKSSIAVSSVA